MKFVINSGGLGNQMFIYAFVLALRYFDKNAIFLLTKKKKNYAHQGYILGKIFNIKRHNGLASFFKSYLFLGIFHLLRVFKKEKRIKIFNYLGYKYITYPNNFIFYPSILNHFQTRKAIFAGTWQSPKYFCGVENQIKSAFQFNSNLLSAETRFLAHEISNNERSISIHFRRGDYQSEKFIDGFGTICNLDYYRRAKEVVTQKVNNPFFYIFSDDPDWVKENIIIENSYIVEFNKKCNGWQDMYLMSCCSHNIIANSTFSWWAAWLNNNPSKIVVAPSKWWSFFEFDDIIPSTWIRV